MKRPSLRVLVLMHQERVPPVSLVGSTEKQQEEWKTEYAVVTALRKLGHEVMPLGLWDEVRPIRDAITDFKPHIAFNLLEEFQGQPLFDQHVVAFLELSNLAYTGCNPRGLTLARDKALTKKILTYHRIDVPAFMVAPRRQRWKRPKVLKFPLIVKSLTEEASLGISQASVVDTDEKLQERVRFIHESIGTDAIIEQYIDGREIYVGALGNKQITVLPPWELVLDHLPADAVHIATRKVKWDKAYQQRHKIKSQAAQLPDAMIRKITHLGRRIYKNLSLSGYARMDFRVTSDGRVFLVEANPNPGVAPQDEFAESAQAYKLDYGKLISKLLTLGRSYKPGTY
ncbi:MAG: D-alanine--D-alanine ligase [Deltaproteobacteria bacterium]|nr:D-alanine--D-alanine ligase [Deltaproteobacteria bacterium]